jgi:hypothetical protein
VSRSVMRSAWSAALMMACASPALPAESPDPPAMERLDTEFRRTPEARVSGPAFSGVLYGARAGAEGVTFASASIGRKQRVPGRRLVAWSDIDRLEVRPRGSGGGILVGAALGFVAGVVWAESAPTETKPALFEVRPTSSGVKVGRMLLGTSVGAAIGTVVGRARMRWRPVYP